MFDSDLESFDKTSHMDSQHESSKPDDDIFEVNSNLDAQVFETKTTQVIKGLNL